MNDKLLKSKKFRTAIIAATTSLLTFLVSEFGLNLDVEKTIGLMVALTTPLLIYIGAEGYSEVEAKRVIEEKKLANKQGDSNE
jgi:hypothetical protein